MTDIMVQINPNELLVLKEIYLQKSTNRIATMTINNYIKWFKRDPNLKNVKVFCLNGDFSDGTFVVIDRYRAYADTCSESNEKMIRLLQLLDYSKGIRFIDLRVEICPAVNDVMKKMDIKIASDMELVMYYLPKEEAHKLDVKRPPADIVIKTLNEFDDLDKIYSVQPTQSENNLPNLQRLMKYNENVGAFTKDGTLVSWALRYQTGVIGSLQTDENYFGHGYASLVVKYLSKKIAETGDDIYVGVSVKNTPPRSLFSKLGFKPIGELHVISSTITWPIDE